MVKAWMEDKAIWLFDLAHGDLDTDAVVKGFIKHYVLLGQGIGDVQQNLHFHTSYGDFYMETAISALRKALEIQIQSSNADKISGSREEGKGRYQGAA